MSLCSFVLLLSFLRSGFCGSAMCFIDCVRHHWMELRWDLDLDSAVIVVLSVYLVSDEDSWDCSFRPGSSWINLAKVSHSATSSRIPA